MKDLMAKMIRFSKQRSLQNEMAQGSRQSEDSSAIVWPEESWICINKLKHYPSFVRSDIEIEIKVNSFVMIMPDLLGYVEDLYEDPGGKKMARIRRFNTQKEIAGRVANLRPKPREIFMTPTLQDISAESIDGIAAVLTPKDFNKCNNYLPQSLSIKSFKLHREIKENQVMAYPLIKLRGYSKQPILDSLKSEVARLSNKRNKAIVQVGASSEPKDPLAHVPRRRRSIRVGVTDGKTTQLSEQLADASTIVAPADPLSLPQPTKLDEKKIEILSQDSGLRGCWFRCKVLLSKGNRLKVQYYDVDDVDGPSGKLVEWVQDRKVEAKDELRMRGDGRRTVRPWPDWDSSENRFEVGEAVDVWWCDGWWEGVVIRRDTDATSKLEVFLPGENIFLFIERKNVRLSKDWIDDGWVSPKAEPDMLCFLSLIMNPVERLTLPDEATNQANSSVPAATIQAAPSSTNPRDGKGKSPVSSSRPNTVDEPNSKKQLIINEDQKQSHKASGSGAGKNGGKGKSVSWSKTAKK